MTDDERGRVPYLMPGDSPCAHCFGTGFNISDASARESCAACNGTGKQEGEARAAGDDQPVTKRGEDGYEHDRLKAQRAEMERRERGKTAAGFINACTNLCKALCAQLEHRAEAAESLAKAERSQRESESEAYRGEIEQLRAEVERLGNVVSSNWRFYEIACADRDAALTKLKHQDVNVDEWNAARNKAEEWRQMANKAWVERDEARVELTDAKATLAHWKHLACDPQTRENINAEKVAECERLRTALVELATWAEGAAETCDRAATVAINDPEGHPYGLHRRGRQRAFEECRDKIKEAIADRMGT